MSRRKPTLRARIAALRADFPDFDGGYMRHYRRSHHVLTIRCLVCHKPAFVLLARTELATVEQIESGGELIPARETVRNSCACRWVARPSAAALRPTIRRAVRGGLVLFGQHGAPTANLAPPAKSDYCVTPHGMVIPLSEAGKLPCPYCDTPTPHPCTPMR